GDDACGVGDDTRGLGADIRGVLCTGAGRETGALGRTVPLGPTGVRETEVAVGSTTTGAGRCGFTVTDPSWFTFAFSFPRSRMLPRGIPIPAESPRTIIFLDPPPLL